MQPTRGRLKLNPITTPTTMRQPIDDVVENSENKNENEIEKKNSNENEDKQSQPKNNENENNTNSNEIKTSSNIARSSDKQERELLQRRKLKGKAPMEADRSETIDGGVEKSEEKLVESSVNSEREKSKGSARDRFSQRLQQRREKAMSGLQNPNNESESGKNQQKNAEKQDDVQSDEEYVDENEREMRTHKMNGNVTTSDGEHKDQIRQLQKHAQEGEIENNMTTENVGEQNEENEETEETEQNYQLPIKQDTEEESTKILGGFRGNKVSREIHNNDSMPIPTTTVLKATIHSCDPLKPDYWITHPLVRIHIINKNTGEYLQKSDPSRLVVTQHENITSTLDGTSRNCTYILPTLTQPHILKGNYQPKWEDTMMWNEEYNHIINVNTIFLFEILDFGPHIHFSKFPNGWLPIAWAFCVVVGANGDSNTEKRLRLQLFKYNEKILNSPSPDTQKMPSVYKQYILPKKQTYPATLYVTLSKMVPPVETQAVDRPFTPFHKQAVRRDIDQLLSENTSQGGGLDLAQNVLGTNETEKQVKETGLRRALEIRRPEGQQCYIPDKVLYKLESGARGCFAVQFSNSGKFLAALCADMLMFPIRVYNLKTGRCIKTFSGHHDLVYDISWSTDDECILTASSDNTVKLWYLLSDSNAESSFRNKSGEGKVVTLQHTCFVYCAQFHPAFGPSRPSSSNIDFQSRSRIVVTGSYDGIIRAWDSDFSKLIKEAVAHQANVNTITFDKYGNRMYSGDGAGLVIVWDCTLQNGKTPKFDALKMINEFKGTPINSIRTHPSGRKLLVHIRGGAGGTICTIDSRFYNVTTKFNGFVNNEWPIKSIYSPCGNYVITGSETNKVLVFGEENGVVCHAYHGSSLGLVEPVASVTWHPFLHILAFSSFGPNQPIIVLCRDPDNLKDILIAPSPTLGLSTISINTTLQSRREKLNLDELDKMVTTLPFSTTSARPPVFPDTDPSMSSSGLFTVPSRTLSPINISPPNTNNPVIATTMKSLRPSTATPSLWGSVRSRFMEGDQDYKRSQRQFRKARREKTLTKTRMERSQIIENPLEENLLSSSSSPSPIDLPNSPRPMSMLELTHIVTKKV